MKKFLFFSIIGWLSDYKVFSQTIPYGTSIDTLAVTLFNEMQITKDENNIIPDYDASYTYQIYYYKSLNYDSSTSPVILFIHALNGTGAQSANIQSIADRRKALIVAPTMHSNNGWVYLWDNKQDSTGCMHTYWIINAITQIYNHVLQRENRTSVPVYLTGFSAGGQFTTRYMLVRQIIKDSIPIQMTVSVSPFSYTFCTDSLNGVQMDYPCGITGVSYIGCPSSTVYDTIRYDKFFCNEHVIQYY